MANDISSFLDRYSQEMHSVATELGEASWQLETTSSEEAKARMVELEVRYNSIFQRPQDWKQVRGYYENREQIQDYALRRQLEHLYLAFAGNQDDPDRVQRVAQLSADIGADFTSFRANLDGRELSDNDIVQILRDDTDSETVRSAWEAGKRIGPVVADRVIELTDLRNEGARVLGYRDFYDQSLRLQEIDENQLFQLLDALDEQTRQRFSYIKHELDERLAQRFGIENSELMPWHYANPFFQEPPALTDVSLNPLFSDIDVVDLSVKAFDRLGLDVRDVLKRSDLYERPDKNQHAFCIHVDTLGDDVRVLCNVRSDEYWATTMLHELGHAVYDKYLPSDLPYLLRSPAHINSTEAIAMLMGRLTRTTDWLHLVVGVDASEAARLGSAARKDLEFQMLTFVRWILVMTHFERALYKDPHRDDLNDLWWQLVSRYQMLQIPDSRRDGRFPDWASKIHIALYPVYYHNYMLGELTASQIQETLAQKSQDRPWFVKEQSGQFLQEHMFRLGALYPWDETVERVTGERLKPEYFVRQFVTPQ